MRKQIASLFLAAALSIGVAGAVDVVVKVAPPAPVHVGPVGVAPGPGYVWVDGYHEYVGDHYLWHEGTWERPPRPHAVWVPHRWVHRNGGYVFIQGRWR